MEIAKAIVLVLMGVLLLGMPFFIWFFVKAIYHYQKLIFGLSKDTYSKGNFILGPFLLSSDKFFDDEAKKSRLLFFMYFKGVSILFIVGALIVLVVAIIRNAH